MQGGRTLSGLLLGILILREFLEELGWVERDS